MEDVAWLAGLARSLGKERFCQQFAGQLFLVKRPGLSATTKQTIEDPPLSYQTSQSRVSSEELDAHDVFGPGLCVWSIQKRRGNPYRDRISVGRARNCDLVLRAPYLSKLHAHFWREADGTWRLSDNRSANGTRVNLRAVAPGEGTRVTSGDRVQFGGLELLALGAELLHPLLL